MRSSKAFEQISIVFTNGRRILTVKPHISRELGAMGWRWRCETLLAVGCSSFSPSDAYRNWLDQLRRMH